jgi:hypothetical protein
VAVEARGVTSAHSVITDGGSSNGAAVFVCVVQCVAGPMGGLPYRNGKAFSQHVKYAAADLAFGKAVTVQTYYQDKYRRAIGAVILPDGMNLKQELVKQGWYWKG